ncbi:MAG: SoxR reducing system RseC family protein [Clostridia bacterium]|nr:SoxR reducing system RseC family protein [Clostridia bacterium]
MRQKATVINTDGKFAAVKVDRVSMCDGCHKPGCGDSCALYKIFGAKSEFEARALNTADASVGDLVYVELSDVTVNLNAFFVFLLPVIIAAVVYFALFFIETEAPRILGAVASFVLYYIVLAVLERRKKNKPVKLVITSLVSENGKDRTE